MKIKYDIPKKYSIFFITRKSYVESELFKRKLTRELVSPLEMK